MKRFISVTAAATCAIFLVCGVMVHAQVSDPTNNSTDPKNTDIVKRNAVKKLAVTKTLANTNGVLGNALTVQSGMKNGRVKASSSARAKFHVKSFRGWTSYCWFPNYRCYGYYSSMDRLWFYWYDPLNRFLPISSMAQYPPISSVTSPTVPAGNPGVDPVTTGLPTTPGLPAGSSTTPSLPQNDPMTPTDPLPLDPATPGDPLPAPPQ